jgi:hypothetical protein
MLALHLKQSASHYNEVVVDTRAWVSNMPHTVEAIFYLDDGDLADCREIQSDFQRTYNLDNDRVPPVLKYMGEPRTEPTAVIRCAGTPAVCSPKRGAGPAFVLPRK